jgi:hypothetical protein
MERENLIKIYYEYICKCHNAPPCTNIICKSKRTNSPINGQMNRYFSEVQMANRYKRHIRHPGILAIKERQIKMTLRFHFAN